MKRIIIFLTMLSTLTFAMGYMNKGAVKGIDVVVSSHKTLSEGNNDVSVKLMKDGKAITNAMVKVKFFMPEMPGMPYMETKSVASLVGDQYKSSVNFSMGGTWQYHILFKIDGKKHRFKGSVNLGQSMSGMDHSHHNH